MPGSSIRRGEAGSDVGTVERRAAGARSHAPTSDVHRNEFGIQRWDMSSELIEQLILVTHLLLALAIIGLIMLQQGKGADMGASFGAGASQTLFGSSGSGNVLTRATAWMVALFFATSFGLAVIAKNKTAPVDDFDLPLPAAEQPVVEDDLPAVDEAGAAMGEIPEVMVPPASDDASAEMGDMTGDELPELE